MKTKPKHQVLALAADKLKSAKAKGLTAVVAQLQKAGAKE